MAVEPSTEWPESKVPADLREALASDPLANNLWVKITPMARWDWLRWIRATNLRETRSRRIEVAIIEAQGRRTKALLLQSEPVHRTGGLKNGVLFEPTQTTK